MKKIVFTEEFCSPEQLFPFTLTRQIQDIRVGILTIREKWEQHLGLVSFDKQEGDYKDLDRAMVIQQDIGDDVVLLIHGNILPTAKLVKAVKKLKPGEFLSVPERENIVYCISKNEIVNESRIKVHTPVDFEDEVIEIRYPWDIIHLNARAIADDFEWLRKNRKEAKLSDSNKTINPKNIFIEKGAWVEHCILNASEGPVFIGRDSVVMEGSLLRGPIAIGEKSIVKMGAKLYGGTTIGPGCTVGGEIKNSVLMGYSNKAHDGYLGDAVIGEWCNLGAGTTCSNIKNNASGVMVYTPNGPEQVGLKCGTLMGDYSRTAINTSLNTGTVVGASANVFGKGLTPKYIPSFSWGDDGIERYDFDKALRDIANWKALKNEVLTDNERTILKHIFKYY